MRSFLQPLTALALAISGTSAQDPPPPIPEMVLSKYSVGGPHGSEFKDEEFVQSGQKLRSITIRGAERVDGITMRVELPGSIPRTFNHGGGGGQEHTLELADDEFINGIEAYQHEHHGHTRLFYLSVSTSKGRNTSAGTRVGTYYADEAPPGCALGGFNGRSGQEIDLIQALWTGNALLGVETTCPALHAVKEGEHVVLGSLGPIGFPAAHSCKLRDAMKILRVDNSSERLKFSPDHMKLDVVNQDSLSSTRSGQATAHATVC
ncbi:hypothetical protein PsorP6_010958 [Peronosclerospora sorghi]|uniref:Uncharacterized protein n=1 Tax=Peronosclerospora sorghi TaxID=230839 RepID=A0ACC0VVW9_9STRA|nr:hypothetical protein PsorP6_010958 [Peronosclerospora sorghi]